MDIRKHIKDACKRDAERREAFAAEMAAHKAEAEIYEQERRAFASHCRLANPSDYGEWLKGYLGRGGTVSHTYNYPMTNPGVTLNGSLGDLRVTEGSPRWMVMCEPPSRVPALYGAFSFNVIIPAGIGFTLVDVPHPGHSEFYFMNGYQVVGGIVPLYTDVAAYLLDGE